MSEKKLQQHPVWRDIGTANGWQIPVRLQRHSAEDGRGLPDRAQRLAAIEKILAVEPGVTDGATLAIVEAGLPSRARDLSGSARDVAAFAAFRHARLAPHLSAH